MFLKGPREQTARAGDGCGRQHKPLGLQPREEVKGAADQGTWGCEVWRRACDSAGQVGDFQVMPWKALRGWQLVGNGEEAPGSGHRHIKLPLTCSQGLRVAELKPGSDHVSAQPEQ